MSMEYRYNLSAYLTSFLCLFVLTAHSSIFFSKYIPGITYIVLYFIALGKSRCPYRNLPYISDNYLFDHLLWGLKV